MVYEYKVVIYKGNELWDEIYFSSYAIAEDYCNREQTDGYIFYIVKEFK